MSTLDLQVCDRDHKDALRAVRQPRAGKPANDPRVNQAESEQIVSAIEKNGGKVSYVLYTDEGHGFAQPENRLDFNHGRREGRREVVRRSNVFRAPGRTGGPSWIQPLDFQRTRRCGAARQRA